MAAASPAKSHATQPAFPKEFESLLLGLSAVRNGRAAGKRVVAECRLPVPGNSQLGAIQELGSLQEGSGEVGAIEHCFEKVRPFQIGIR